MNLNLVNEVTATQLVQYVYTYVLSKVTNLVSRFLKV